MPSAKHIAVTVVIVLGTLFVIKRTPLAAYF